MRSLFWSDLALTHLAEILVWYEDQGGEQLSLWVRRYITEQISLYQDTPLSPRSLPEKTIGAQILRKLVMRKIPYVLYMREKENHSWEIVDIIHTSRKPKNIL